MSNVKEEEQEQENDVLFVSKEEVIANVTKVVSEQKEDIRGFVFIASTDNRISSGHQGYEASVAQAIAEFLNENRQYIAPIQEVLDAIKTIDGFGLDKSTEN